MFTRILGASVAMTIGATASDKAFAANPYNLDDRCLPFYQEYRQASDNPKAFVAAKNGLCGFWHGALSALDAKAKAIAECQRYGGSGCRLVEHVD